ncbi:unnamed protein product [Sympodiomycopsis kandeliae]
MPSTKPPGSSPYDFPSYETIPGGAAYSGAPANYGKDHLTSIHTSSGSAEDKGNTVFSPETFTQGGMLRIAKDRITQGMVDSPSPDALSKGAQQPDKSQPGFKIWYEVHGSGPEKVVFIMGLNNSCFSWLPQIEEFSKKNSKYTCLVMDNRGYGNSEIPSETRTYKTSEMAKDVLEVCDHLKWTEKNQLHITGVSMGGMISLEVAKQQPHRLASLTLLSTTSGRSQGQRNFIEGLPPVAALSTITRLLGGKILGLDSDQYRVQRLADTLFPPEWLDEPSPSHPGRKRRQDIYDMFTWRFHFTRRQVVRGSMGQFRACLTHRVSNEQLQQIAEKVPSILIVTGDWDNLVKPANSHHLAKYLAVDGNKSTFIVIKGAGHALHAQDPDRINSELQKNWQRGWKATH